MQSPPRSKSSPAFAGWDRWAPLTGVAFVILFLASIVVSSPPDSDASDATWVANYATTSKELGHLATGICLILAGLCLASFLTVLWTRVAALRRPEQLHPLPLVTAAIAGACIAVGGLFMGLMSGADLSSATPLVKDAELLRLGTAAGFGLVSVAGMPAAALTVVLLGAHAYAAGLFGRALLIFSIAVAVILLASILFIPIVALLIWSVVVAVVLIRRPVPEASPAGTPLPTAAQG